MKTQTKKLNMLKILAAVLVLATILCGSMIGTGVYNASAATAAGRTYYFVFNRTYLSTANVNLKEKLNSITVRIYDSQDKEIESIVKVRKDNDNWLDDYMVEYNNSTGSAVYYTITYQLVDGNYPGVYWKITAGGEKYVSDGIVTTNKIYFTNDTVHIYCCEAMSLVSYKFLSFKVVGMNKIGAYKNWDIKMTNNNPFGVRLYFLNQLCFKGDAENCYGYTANHRARLLGAYGASDDSKTERINPNAAAGYATACFMVPDLAVNVPQTYSKYVTYANNLKYDAKTNTYSCSVYTGRKEASAGEYSTYLNTDPTLG